MLNRQLGRFGYSISKRTTPQLIDVRASGNNPYSRLYAGTRASILVELRMEGGRDPTFLSIRRDGNHPFVRAALAGLEHNSPDAVNDSLRSFYMAQRPQTASEQLGSPCPEAFKTVPPWAFVWPWETSSIASKMARSLAQQCLSAERALGTRDLHISHGWKFAGPVSELMLENETRRLWALVVSLRKNGCQRHEGKNGDIEAAVLEDDNGDLCWSISSGNHRAAALSALDYQTVPVRVHTLIRRKDCEIWPNVTHGLYTPDQARAVFDRLFKGEAGSLTISSRETVRTESAHG